MPLSCFKCVHLQTPKYSMYEPLHSLIFQYYLMPFSHEQLLVTPTGVFLKSSEGFLLVQDQFPELFSPPSHKTFLQLLVLLVSISSQVLLFPRLGHCSLRSSFLTPGRFPDTQALLLWIRIHIWKSFQEVALLGTWVLYWSYSLLPVGDAGLRFPSLSKLVTETPFIFRQWQSLASYPSDLLYVQPK